MSIAAADYATLKQLIGRLNTAPPNEVAQVQKTLFDAQASVEAWVWPVALLAEEDPQLRFFGGHTLQIKIGRDWESLASGGREQTDGLKRSLLGWIQQSAAAAYPPAHSGVGGIASEKVVLRKLAAALSSLTLRLHATDEWPNWALEVIATLSASTSTNSGCSKQGVFEVLNIIVEESSRADLMGKVKEINEAGHLIARSIIDVLQPNSNADPQTVNSAVNAAAVWISAGQISAELADIYPLLLQHLAANNENATQICPCLEELLLHASGNFFTPTRLQPLLHLCTSTWMTNQLEEARNTGDVDENTTAAIKLFVTLFEFHIATMAAEITSPQTIAMLRILLAVTSFPGNYPVDEEISSLGMTCWGLLQEDLSMNGTPIHHEKPEYQVTMDVFRALVDGLRMKTQWPDDSVLASWPKDIQGQFRNYRTDAADALLNAYYILRDEMIISLVEAARMELQKTQATPQAVHTLEGILYVIQSIGEGVPHGLGGRLESILSNDFLSGVLSVGYQPTRLRKTALGVIERYAEWIAQHSGCLLPAVTFIIQNIEISEFSQSAARALQQLCEACKADLGPHISDFAVLMGNLKGRVPTPDYVKVVGSVASVVQALPPEQAVAPMIGMASHLVNDLGAHLSTSATPDTRERVLEDVQCLASCADGFVVQESDTYDLDSSDNIQPASIIRELPETLELRRKFGQVLVGVVDRYAADGEIAEAMSDLFKAASFESSTSPLALDPVDLLALLGRAIEISTSSVWLGIAASLPSRIAGRDLTEERRPAYCKAVHALVQPSLDLLSSREALDANPDVIQSLMAFLREVARYAIKTLLAMPELLHRAFSTAIEALVVQERVALQRTLAFVTSITHESASTLAQAELLRQLVLASLSAILYKVLQGIGGSLPRSTLPSLSELLHAVVSKYPDQCRLHISQHFQQSGFPSIHLTVDDKDRFIKAVMASRTLRKMRTQVENFAILSRNLQNSSYGAGSRALVL